MSLCIIIAANDAGMTPGGFIYRYEEGYQKVKMKTSGHNVSPDYTYGIMYPCSYFDGKVMDLNRQFSPKTKGHDWEMEDGKVHFTNHPAATHEKHGTIVQDLEQDAVDAALDLEDWNKKL